MLPKYHDKFEDPEKLAHVMREEWKKNVCNSKKERREGGTLQTECKVIRVKYAYNHIQVRPAYNK